MTTVLYYRFIVSLLDAAQLGTSLPMRAFACCQHASGRACALQEKAEEEGSPRSKPDPTLQKEADEDP